MKRNLSLSKKRLFTNQSSYQFRLIKLFLIGLLIGSVNISYSQSNSTQTVRGVILDSENEYPLFGATIILVSDSSTKTIGAVTDIDGRFEIQNVPIGRQLFKSSYVGYKEQMIPNFLVVKGKEGYLHIKMEESANKLEEFVVKSRGRGELNNEAITLSANTLEQGEIIRFSGSLGDVSRMAQNFAGVSGASDNRNDVIVRGNSPSSVLWRMDGVDIPSPNHWATLGSTGGSVSMLNTNNLRTSDFISGAFPSEYGNVTGAVFDLKLRNGNSNKYEFLGQVGFNGFELGAEGPIKGIGQNASFLINYRYSTLGLLHNIGISVGTGNAIPKYQDINFKISVPTKKLGSFYLWGLGGISDISFLADDKKTNLYSAAGSNLSSGSNTGILGFNHKYYFNKKTSSTISLALSGTESKSTTEEIILPGSNQFEKTFDANSNQVKTTVNWTINSKINTKNTVKFGVNYDNFKLRTLDSVLVDNTFWFNKSDFDGSATLLRSFGQWQHKFSDKLKLNAGLNTLYLGLNNSFAIEPRLGLSYNINDVSTLAVAYGRHNQMQTLPIYFTQRHDATPEQNAQNRALDFAKSDHFVLSYSLSIKENLKLKLEGYYQRLFSIAIDPNEGTFSALNIGAGFAFPNNVGLVNEGTGKNYGLELTLQQSLNKGYYFLLTGSAFKSKYTGSDGIERGSFFNSNYVTNFLIGKEINVRDNLTITLDAKFTTAGGRRYTPIDLEASRIAKTEVLDNSRAFEMRYDQYIRPDFKIGMKTNIKKTTHTWSIDLQNFIGRKNVFMYRYEDATQSINTLYQRGFLPDVRYQILF